MGSCLCRPNEPELAGSGSVLHKIRAGLQAGAQSTSSLHLSEVIGVVLPLLGANDLAALLCTSRELRRIVNDAGPSIWEAAARRFMGQPHPLQPNPSRACIDQALRTYAAAQRNIATGAYGGIHILASSACFNASGTHLAVTDRNILHVFETEHFSCVTSFSGFAAHGLGHSHVQWGPRGTVGSFLTLIDEHSSSSCVGPVEGGARLVRPDTWVLCKGDLAVEGQEGWSRPWRHLTSIPTHTARQILLTLQASPDLSKVFVSRLEADGDHPGDGSVVCLAMDTTTGAVLWRRELRHSDEPTLTCTAVAWHPDSQTFFFNTYGRKSRSIPAEVWAVTLAGDALLVEAKANIRTLYPKARMRTQYPSSWRGHLTRAVSGVVPKLAWSPAGNLLAVALQPRHSGAGVANVLVIDARFPKLTVIACLDFEGNFEIHSLQWTPDSSQLCALGDMSYMSLSEGGVGKCACIFWFKDMVEVVMPWPG
ncbi:hypothetical protein WJX73_009228 [Symbiochloris irregularis]|uniref:F-box domain-containing protein n=1 Tax=Symbiochloris irregularis TaxID=706552 RepID=A0AAW1PR18_9CHLO